MRSALLATVVLVITALACTSQGESPESATAPPNLGNTPRPTHTPQPAAPAILPATAPPSLENTPRPTHTPAPTTPAILSATAPPSLENTPRPTHTSAPTTPATLPATAPPTLENTPRPTHTPAPATPATYPAFQPGERAYVHQFVRDMVADGALKFGDPAPTEAEYRDTCVLLRKHDWELVDSFMDPDATLQTFGIAGSLVVGFTKLTLIQEERGYAEYSLADFCEDVTGTPHPTTPATLPATAPPAPVNTPHPATPTTLPTFQPGQREYLYEGVKEIVSDTLEELGQPDPTEAEYRATCTLLRKHDWELADFFSDPDATVQTSGMAGALVGGFKELTLIQEERGLAVYSLAHFCEDVLEQ